MSTLTLPILATIWLLILLLLRLRPATRPLGLDVAAGGVLGLLTLGFFWRVGTGEVFLPGDGGDLVSFLYPTYRYAAAQLHQWSLPLWNPTLYGGAPFIGDIQAGFLYLPNLLLFLFQPDFDYKWMQWLVMGHIYWAGLGVYVLLRTLRFGADITDSEMPAPLSRPAALFGAVAFMFSHPLLIHLGNLNLIAVLSWLPWVLAAYQRSLTAPDARRTLRWAALAALLFALGNYAGHAQSTYYVGLALIVMTVAVSGQQVAAARPPNNFQFSIFNFQFLQPFLALLTTGILTILLTAPILFPALEMATFTERSAFTYQDTVAFSLAPAQLIGLLTPGFFGNGPALHWGLWDRVELPYAGVITLLAALFALFGLTRKETRRDLWPWLGLAAFGMVTALGIYGVVHGWLTVLLPGFDQFRAPARATVLWTLAVAVLGAVGVERLSQGKRQGAKGKSGGEESTDRGDESPILKSGAAFLGGLTLISFFALFLTQGDEKLFERTSVALLAVILALAFWLGTWALMRGRRSGWLGPTGFAIAALALLFFDLSATGAYTDISPVNPTTGYDHPEIVAFLKSDPDLFRIDTRTGMGGLWQPDAAALHGLQDVGGIANPLTLSNWTAYVEAIGGRDTAAYRTLNVKYTIAKDGTPFPANFELALDAPDELSVFRNTDFGPRAWVVDGAGIGDGELGIGAVRGDRVEITQYGSNELALAVDASAPGYVVISEVWYPGWRATVNGSEADVVQADGALRAVAIPAGASTVMVHFAPVYWRWGLIALGTGLLLLLLIALPRRRPQPERVGSKKIVK